MAYFFRLQLVRRLSLTSNLHRVNPDNPDRVLDGCQPQQNFLTATTAQEP